MNYYVLYASKQDNSRIYISNIHPTIWDLDISNAKHFIDRYTPEYYILRTLEVYRYMKQMIENGIIAEVHILLLHDGIEEEDIKLL